MKQPGKNVSWFRKWWGDPKPTSSFDYLDRPYQPPRRMAQFVRTCTAFCAREWKWVVGSIAAVVGYIIKQL